MFRPGRRVERFFWAGVPGVITFFLAVFSLSSRHLGGLNHFMPLLPLIPVFYWGVYHAREMPYWFVFALGLMVDAVVGTPMGLSSLIYVFFLLLLHNQRRFIYKEGFVIKWIYFAALLAAMCAANWVALSLYYSHAQTVMPAVLQWLLTVCCYPVLHKLFDMLYDRANSRRWQIGHGG